MQKIDFKKELKSLYAPSKKEFELIAVPAMQFVMVDGIGPPHGEKYAEALSWLYPISYGLKFHSKKVLEKDYVVPPLEGIWWAEDYSAFVADRRDEWKWTMMIMQPEWITPEMFEGSKSKAIAKLGDPPETLRLAEFDEGLCVQIMHIGPYSEEAPTLARLHNEFLPENGLAENGEHHEIYVSDPRKSAPEKLKTILRQPVKKV